MPTSPAYRPSPAHTALGDAFYDVVKPAPFPDLTLRYRDDSWAAAVGLGGLTDDEWCAHFGRFTPLPDNLPAPLALRYHGHQFTTYNARLGDGRGFLFAQLRGPAGRLLDLGTKGSGPTPYSRGGDGRLTLKGGVRELMASALLEARGVPTSKTFSLIETGEQLYRSDEPSPTRSCVMVRLGHSHIRFGTFQRLAYHNDTHGLRRLLDHCIAHHYPHLSGETDRAAAFLHAVAGRAAEMTASWTAAGFVHGVLNTDNMNINGESFDYGPWRFLPTLDQEFVAAYFDGGGLYRFGRQPAAVLWNLEQLARCFAPLGSTLSHSRAIADFEARYLRALTGRVLDRLGLSPLGDAADDALVRACFSFLQQQSVGFERFFFDWYGGMASYDRAMASPAGPAYRAAAFQPVMAALAGWSARHPERLSAPYFARQQPLTMLIEEVEALWDAINYADSWTPLLSRIAEIRAMGRLLDHGPPEASDG